MKKLLLIPLFLLIISCQHSRKSNNEKIIEKLSYFKDERTGLCFASVNSKSYGGIMITSITCVPCDSLKRVELELK